MSEHFDAGTNRMIEPAQIGEILKDAFVRNMSNEVTADLHGITRKAVYDIIWKHRGITQSDICQMIEAAPAALDSTEAQHTHHPKGIIMNTEKRELHKIKALAQKRDKAAQRKGRMTPKGHSSFISEAHTPGYKDAIRSLRAARQELKPLLLPRIKQDRANSLTWKAIREKYEISQATLKDVRSE